MTEKHFLCQLIYLLTEWIIKFNWIKQAVIPLSKAISNIRASSHKELFLYILEFSSWKEKLKLKEIMCFITSSESFRVFSSALWFIFFSFLFLKVKSSAVYLIISKVQCFLGRIKNLDVSKLAHYSNFEIKKQWGDIMKTKEEGWGTWYPLLPYERSFYPLPGAIVPSLKEWHLTFPKFVSRPISCRYTGREVGYCNWQDVSDSWDCQEYKTLAKLRKNCKWAINGPTLKQS